MKLVKCYVSSFGKLKDFTCDFSSDLNVIKEDNGWGKSTLATFIKVMFYGLNGSAKRNISDNERKKYRPWNSTEKFGGYVQFVWGQDEFVLERYFGLKEAEDTVKLSSVKTGKTFSNTDNLGKRIFEIDEEGFMSTTYLSQKDFEIKSNPSLTAKFNSVCEVSDDDAFLNALTKLEQKAKSYKYSGDRGLIADAKREIYAVDEDIEKAKHAETVAQTLRSECEQLKAETEELKRQTATLTEKVAVAGKAEAVKVKRQRLSQLNAQKEQLDNQIANVNNLLGGKTFSQQSIEQAENDEKEIIAISSKMKLIEEEIVLAQSVEEKKKPEPKNKQIISCAIISALFLIEGLSTVWFNPVLGALGLVLFAITAVLLSVIAFGGKKNKGQAQEQMFLQKRIEKLREYSLECDGYKQRVNAFLAGCNLQSGITYGQAISQIKFGVEKLSSYQKEYASVQKEIEQLIAQIGGESEQNTDDLATLKKQLEVVQSAYSEKSSALAIKQANYKRYEEFAESLSDFTDKKEVLLNNLETYKKEHEVTLKTIEFLKCADDNLKTKYRAPLQDSLNKYLALIDGGKTNAKIDIDLLVTIEEKVGSISTEYYSKGYQNLFEICKRFALTDVLFTGEKPFIILDDPFYNLDDEKLKNALDLIKKLSSEYQIIYFICHESRSV